MKKHVNIDYYVGLDLGTGSVGYAVTDAEYNVIKFRKKNMLGVRLFDTAETAEVRRIKRSARRRLARRKHRVATLQSFFAEEIAKKDFCFFKRLKESNLYGEDLTVERRYPLFNDQDFTDKDYYKKYPTIYHLRNELQNNKEVADIRLLYLACHHIIKYRGNFLYENIEGNDSNGVACVSDLMNELNELLKEMNSEFNSEPVDLSFELENVTELEKVAVDINLSNAKKSEKIKTILNANKRQFLIIKAFVGQKVKLSDIFEKEEYKDSDLDSLELCSAEYDTIKDNLALLLNEDFPLIDHIQKIYTWFVMKKLLKDNSSISEAMVKIYEKHQMDLRLLKQFFKKYLPSEYNNVFKTSDDKTTNYCSYVGMCKVKGEKLVVKKCGFVDFYKFIKKKMAEVDDKIKESSEYLYIMGEIENQNFLPKQVTSNNGYIPYQLNLLELEKILNNQLQNYPFLSEKDKYGTIAEKIVKLLSFKIPYYVGPLGNSEKYGWKVRKTNDFITPWNIDEVVDYEATMEVFIRRLTNKCTYLKTEDVIPLQSLLYSEYCVLNELNKIRVDGVLLSVEVKTKIYEQLFKKYKTVKEKHLKDFLLSIGYITDDKYYTLSITGYQKEKMFASSLSSYIAFYNIIGDKVEKHKDAVEKIIELINIYDNRQLLEKKITSDYGHIFSINEIKLIKGLKFTGWSRLSSKLLVNLRSTDKETGEVNTIMTLLRNTNLVFMEIIYDQKYGFGEIIKKENEVGEASEITYDDVNELYCSPSVKRSIWQSMLIVNEIEKIMGHKPKKIFIECTRSNTKPKERTNSRQFFLKECYKQFKDFETKKLLEDIEKSSDSELRKDRLFLYFLQQGKCMYSGRPINLSELNNSELYDIDHIIPRSLLKDDSISNKVLVEKKLNTLKSDNYPIAKDIQTKMASFWLSLKTAKLIDDKKYERLIRKSYLTLEEQAGFINRQLIETSQAVKSLGQLLEMSNPETEIIYSKAENVSDFRQRWQLPKLREINDFHHAKDAYLNIVVGNVFKNKFGRNARYSLLNSDETYENKYKYNLNKLYDRSIADGSLLVWGNGTDAPSTALKVTDVMYDNNVVISKKTYTKKGAFYGEEMKTAEEGLVPIKNTEIYQKTEKYGGYKGTKTGYFFVVEGTVKNKREITVESVPVSLVEKIGNSMGKLTDYCIEIGIVQPKVLSPRINVNSLIKYNGAIYYLAGVTGNRLLLHNAIQCYVNRNDYDYLKKVIRYNDLNNSKDITSVDNLRIYNMFIEKMEKAYKGIIPFCQTVRGYLTDEKAEFTSLSLKDQCVILSEIMKMLKCDHWGANLSLLGKGKECGKTMINKKITGGSFSVVNQSVTGLFENVIKITG